MGLTTDRDLYHSFCTRTSTPKVPSWVRLGQPASDGATGAQEARTEALTAVQWRFTTVETAVQWRPIGGSVRFVLRTHTRPIGVIVLELHGFPGFSG